MFIIIIAIKLDFLKQFKFLIKFISLDVYQGQQSKNKKQNFFIWFFCYEKMEKNSNLQVDLIIWSIGQVIYVMRLVWQPWLWLPIDFQPERP